MTSMGLTLGCKRAVLREVTHTQKTYVSKTVTPFWYYLTEKKINEFNLVKGEEHCNCLWRETNLCLRRKAPEEVCGLLTGSDLRPSVDPKAKQPKKRDWLQWGCHLFHWDLMSFIWTDIANGLMWHQLML